MTATMTVQTVDWRRPGCDSRCWRDTVLVVGERQTRTIDVHDADAHEDYIREALGGASPTSWRGAVQFGPLRVDFRSSTVSVLSMPVENLTRREWGVLMYLVKNAGRLIQHRELIEAVWGREYLVSSDDVYLRSAISGLRRKLWEAGELIQNTHGQGYRLLMEIPNHDEPRPRS